MPSPALKGSTGVSCGSDEKERRPAPAPGEPSRAFIGPPANFRRMMELPLSNVIPLEIAQH